MINDVNSGFFGAGDSPSGSAVQDTPSGMPSPPLDLHVHRGQRAAGPPPSSIPNHSQDYYPRYASPENDILRSSLRTLLSSNKSTSSPPSSPPSTVATNEPISLVSKLTSAFPSLSSLSTWFTTSTQSFHKANVGQIFQTKSTAAFPPQPLNPDSSSAALRPTAFSSIYPLASASSQQENFSGQPSVLSASSSAKRTSIDCIEAKKKKIAEERKARAKVFAEGVRNEEEKRQKEDIVLGEDAKFREERAVYVQDNDRPKSNQKMQGELKMPFIGQDVDLQMARLKREESIFPSLPLPDVKRRPGPLDLSSTIKAIATPYQHSALASARIIEDLSNVPYPDGIKSPKVELNFNAKKGKFRYDRDFLLQFKTVCKEKPDSLPPLDALGLEPTDQPSFDMARGRSGRRQSSTGLPSSLSGQTSVGLGISGFKESPSDNFSLGNSTTPTSEMTSEKRFAVSSGNRVASATVGEQSGMPFGRPAPMVCSASQGGSGALGSNRMRSKRGEKRNDANKVNAPTSSYATQAPTTTGGISAFEPVQPPEISTDRWTRKAPATDPDSPEVVERNVTALLNKLTMKKFDSISDQIINWANKSENEKDGRTLIQVIKLVFEKAIDEAAWSEMYARLCRKMMEQIGPNVQDEGIKDTKGKPVAGGQLFRKYLLNRCQEDFERGWAVKDAAASAAAAKASEDEAAKTTGEAELYSEEYYTEQKAKRQGLGLIQFIGELYKLQMLTERIMHECIKKLLGNVDNPEEEEIESLCRLLTTVGQLLDNVKARAHMDIYFSRMKELIKSSNVSHEMHSMLQDLIELRERKWVPRDQVAAPTTIAHIHEAAVKERSAHEKEASMRTLTMFRGGLRRGGDRGTGGEHMQGADGWSVADGSQSRPQPKAGDLSNLGKINKTAQMTFGPSRVFAGEKDSNGDSELSRTNPSSNVLLMSGGGKESAASGSTVESSRPSMLSGRRTSADLGQSGIPEPPAHRRKLQLLPRARPVKETKANRASEGQSEDGSDANDNAPLMSEDEAEKKIVEDIKAFFCIRNIDKSEGYFSKLPSKYRHRLVDKMVKKAIESKEADAQLVAGAFQRAVEKNLCSPESFEEGFIPIAKLLDYIVIDAPKAFDMMAIMMIGAGLDKDEERYSRIADKLEDKDQLLSHFT